ncbi:hypothetical protein BT96DRAFT_1003862 [Gymnopus androsaceus JB14]|uniref:Uncharacterized protein n=1 Tax=Gymnopus androsaceus JB14 TaxID=1447944 RepID=A0A6A4GSY8_9AGAR|nr:hypothetical protein BT96DRAFT_1003862 [Gymnopus androsaceus JB14]
MHPSNRCKSCSVRKSFSDHHVSSDSLILVDKTISVDCGCYSVPNNAQLRLLHTAHHVVKVELSDDISPMGIDRQVRDSFANRDPSPLRGHPEFLDGWRLGQIKLAGRHGKKGKLILFLPGHQVTFEQLDLAAEPIRTNDPYGKKFPERVYIILKEDTPDLPVAGLEETNLLPSESDTLEIQSDSSKEVTQDPLRAYTPSLNADVNMEPQLFSQDDDFDMEQPIHNDPHMSVPGMPFDSPSDSFPVEEPEYLQTFKSIQRMLHNISKPTSAEIWWPTSPMGEYKLLTTQLIPTLARRLQVLESGIPTRSTLDLVISQSREPNEFFPSLDFLLKAVEILDQPGPSTSKNDLPVFGPYALSLGPNGLTPIIEILVRLGLLIEGNKSQYDIIQYQTMTESILALCQPMNHLVYHFRHTIPRVRWDPPGYRQFFDTLRLRENLESKLEASMANAVQRYEILAIDPLSHQLQFNSVLHWKSVLIADFGSATSAKDMVTENIRLGSHGLDGISAFLTTFLDNTPLFPEYNELRNVFGIFCGEMVKKLNNIKKTKKSKKDTKLDNTEILDSSRKSQRGKERSRDSLEKAPESQSHEEEEENEADDPPLFAGLSESDSDTCPFAKSQPTAEWTRTASIDVDSDIESLYPGSDDLRKFPDSKTKDKPEPGPPPPRPRPKPKIKPRPRLVEFREELRAAAAEDPNFSYDTPISWPEELKSWGDEYQFLKVHCVDRAEANILFYFLLRFHGKPGQPRTPWGEICNIDTLQQRLRRMCQVNLQVTILTMSYNGHLSTDIPPG